MKKLKIVISWLLAVAVMVLIFYFSSQPAVESDDTSGGLIKLIYDIYIKIASNPCPASTISIIEEWSFFVRKAAHFSIYLTLGFLLCNSFYRSGIKRLCRTTCISFALSALYAASDEFHQLFVEGRSGEIRDVFLDSCGAATGIVIFVLIIMLRSKLWTSKKH